MCPWCGAHAHSLAVEGKVSNDRKNTNSNAVDTHTLQDGCQFGHRTEMVPYRLKMQGQNCSGTKNAILHPTMLLDI